MKSLEQMRDGGAERYAWDKGTAHGNRTEPAWHYSVIDYKAGFDACAALYEEKLKVAVDALGEVWHQGVCAGDLKDKICAALKELSTTKEKG